jgi:hypothetical protein
MATRGLMKCVKPSAGFDCLILVNSGFSCVLHLGVLPL